MSNSLMGMVLVFAASLPSSQIGEAGDWPTHRGDVRRSGVTTEALSISNLQPAWVYRSAYAPIPAWGAKPSKTILTLKSSDASRRIEDARLKRIHTVTLNGLARNRLYQYTIETAGQGGTGVTPTFDLETHFNYSLPELGGHSGKSGDVNRDVDAVLSHSPVKRGLCLVYGCGDGRFLHELARRTRFRVIAVDTDAKRVDDARRFLRSHAAYGARVTVRRVTSFDKLPFCGHFANLAVALRGSNVAGTSLELVRMLRPSGGVAVLGFRDTGAQQRKQTRSRLSRVGQAAA